MRGVAVLLVICAHAGMFGRLLSLSQRHHLHWLHVLFEIDPGDLGVSIFFVISGYLITTLLLRGLNEGKPPRLNDFYLRRFFRIFPPYYGYLAVIACLWAWQRVPFSTGNLVSALTYTSNYYPYTASRPESFGWLAGHTWSLSLEEQFYVFWPVCLRYLGTRAALRVGLGICAFSPVSRLLTLAVHPAFGFDGQVARMFHTRMDTVMFGCVLSLLAAHPQARQSLTRAANRSWLALLAGLLLLTDLHMTSTRPQIALGLGITVEGFLLAFLLFYFVTNPTSFAGRILNHSILVHIGLISYSLYLWQQLFDGPVHIIRGSHGLWLISIFACAEVSYFFVEKQSTRVRDYLLARRRSASAR